jgi:hypothetical protein
MSHPKSKRSRLADNHGWRVADPTRGPVFS